MQHKWKEYSFGDGVFIALCSSCQCQFIPKRKDEICNGVVRSNTTKARTSGDVSRFMQTSRVGELSD